MSIGIQYIKEQLKLNATPITSVESDFRPVVVSGYNSDVDTGTVPEALTDLATGLYWPTSASTLSIVSNSAQDTVGTGTGCWVLLIEGLDANWNELTEIVNLTGLTPVVTSNAYLRVNSLRAVFCGSGQTNAGLITATHGATPIEEVLPSTSLSSSLKYSVPAGHELFLTTTRFSIRRSATAQTAEIINKTFVSGVNTLYLGTYQTIPSNSPQGSSHNLSMARVPEKSDIWYECSYASANNLIVSGFMRGILGKVAATHGTA